jgi:hypothetical protein
MSDLKTFQQDFYQLTYGSEEEQTAVLARNTLLASVPALQVQQYQWMVYANHADTLESIYPYCFKLLQHSWKPLVQTYLQQAPPRHYQLYSAAVAFPAFLAQQTEWVERWPFLEDLATYELLEATVLRSQGNVKKRGGLQQCLPLAEKKPVLNQTGQLFTSAYPIHTLVEALKQNPVDESYLATVAEEPLTLWVYRDRGHQCRFFEITLFIQLFLQVCKQQPEPTSYETLLTGMCSQLNLNITPELLEGFQGLLHQLEALDILLGTDS